MTKRNKKSSGDSREAAMNGECAEAVQRHRVAGEKLSPSFTGDSLERTDIFVLFYCSSVWTILTSGFAA